MQKFCSFALRLLAFVMCVLLCCTMMPARAEEVREESEFIRPVAQAKKAPDGYTPIYTADDLQKIINDTSGKFILMADIDLGGASPLSNYGFRGELDGNGYRITGLKLTGYANFRDTYGFGLFAWVRNAVIRNLYVQGEIFMTDTGYYGATANVGGVAGYIFGSSQVTNCVSDVQITCHESMISREDQHLGGGMGGIAGSIGCDDGAVISYCRNVGFVSGGENVGGIVGTITNYQGKAVQNTAVYGCRNDGEVEGRWTGVGGVVGQTDNRRGRGDTSVRIESCANFGRVTGQRGVGGVLGLCDDDSGSAEVKDSLNAGELYGELLGETSVSGIAGGGDCAVTTCVNVGSLTGAQPCGIHPDVRSGYITGCYIRMNALDQMTMPGQTVAVSREEARRKESFPALDFEKVWVLEDGMDHPIPAAVLNIMKWITYSPLAWEKDISDLKGNDLRESAVEEIMNGYTFTDEELAGVIICMAEGYGEYPGNGDGRRARSSALCVVWKNQEIVFAADNCATYPDYPTDASQNEGTAIPTVIDGKYGAYAVNHLPKRAGEFNYPALKVKGPVLCRVNGAEFYIDTVNNGGINIHAKSTETLGLNSQGCTVIGYGEKRRNGRTILTPGNEYTRFALLTGFAADRDGDGYAEIEADLPYVGMECTVIFNRTYGYDHVPEFAENFNADYKGRQEIVDTILGR